MLVTPLVNVGPISITSNNDKSHHWLFKGIWIWILLNTEVNEEGVVLYGGSSQYRTSNSGKLRSTRAVTATFTSTLNTPLTETNSRSKQIPFGFTTSAKWGCIILWMIPMFWMILMISNTAWPSKWRYYKPLQCCEPLAQHCVKSQELNPQQQLREKLKSKKKICLLLWA